MFVHIHEQWMNNSLPRQVSISKIACLIWPLAWVTANKSIWTCVMRIYARKHNPLCSMQKYFLLPWLLWVLGSISAWKIMSLTSVSRLETIKYCRVLSISIHLGVIPSLLSIGNRIHIKTLHWHMLPSCQLSQWLLLGPGTELGLTSGTKTKADVPSWGKFVVQEGQIVTLGYSLRQIMNGASIL